MEPNARIVGGDAGSLGVVTDRAFLQVDATDGLRVLGLERADQVADTLAHRGLQVVVRTVALQLRFDRGRVERAAGGSGAR